MKTGFLMIAGLVFGASAAEAAPLSCYLSLEAKTVRVVEQRFVGDQRFQRFEFVSVCDGQDQQEALWASEEFGIGSSHEPSREDVRRIGSKFVVGLTKATATLVERGLVPVGECRFREVPPTFLSGGQFGFSCLFVKR